MAQGYEHRSTRVARRPRMVVWLMLALVGSGYTGCAKGEDYDYGYGPPQPPMRAGGRGEGGGIMGPLAVGFGSFMAAKWFLSGRRKARAKITIEKDMEHQTKQIRMEVAETNRQFDEYELLLRASLKEKQMQAGQLEEFLYSLPDTNKDGLISRYEFDKYMNDYKRTHPGLGDHDLPRFEDMDHDSNGHINFQEWEEYQIMAMTPMA